MSPRRDPGTVGGAEAIVERVRAAERPLATPDDLDPLLERIGDARFVLLGEASHGTSEYYTWRARISRRLIEERGFSFVAVEGDWPDCRRVDRYVRGRPDSGRDAYGVLHGFRRWPTWMWANWEVAAFAEWLRRHNAALPESSRAGFYGLDVYSLHESLAEVLAWLRRNHPGSLDAAVRALRCFEPHGEDVQAYAWSAAVVPESCEDEVVELLAEVRRRALRSAEDSEADFDAEQNAQAAASAERYYRTMIRGDETSWNVRDVHMADTLDRLVRRHGPQAKAIVWEHNTHIGDARATDMAAAGMVNVGQLVRDRHRGDGVVLVGFGGHRGSVIAGRAWGAPMERMPVPRAVHGSWEDLLHRAGAHDRLLLSADLRAEPGALERRGHRAIGVVYDPDRERGNYVPSRLPERYDAFLHFDETRALHPLHLVPDLREPPDTYPWGF